MNPKNSSEFKYEEPSPSVGQNEVRSGDIVIVNLPVKALIEHSDKIISDYDSYTDTVLEYKSGHIMNVLPYQKFVYNGEHVVLLANTIEPAIKPEEKILYWAKSLEHKSLSLHELVENAKWLLHNVR